MLIEGSCHILVGHHRLLNVLDAVFGLVPLTAKPVNNATLESRVREKQALYSCSGRKEAKSTSLSLCL